MGEPTYEDLLGPEIAKDEDLSADAKLQAHDLFLRLQESFTPPGYVTLEEVRDATGFDGTRTADAMAISLYRSRGKALWGFEFKVSRNDWLKELKQPEKSETILRYCHHWALVVPTKDIVKPGELPSSWGMYVAQKTRLKCVVPAPLLEPLPMSMTMFTALIYAVGKRQSKIDERALNEARNAGYKEGAARTNADYYEKLYKELQEKVKKFENAAGLNIEYGWNIEKIGETVKMLMDGDAPLKRILDTAKYNLRKTEDLKVEMERQIKVLESAMSRTHPHEDEKCTVNGSSRAT